MKIKGLVKEDFRLPKTAHRYTIFVDTPYGQEEYNYDDESEAIREWDYFNTSDNVAGLIDNETGVEWDGFQWR